MKHLLLAIALVFALLSSGYSYGQNISDSALKALRITVTSTGATTSSGIEIGVSGQTKQDTVKVLMLVCDTSDNKSPERYGGLNSPMSKITNKTPLIWWQFGYEVVSDYGLSSWDEVGNRINRKYLDEKKKPLPKSIVVWVTKEIKP